MAKRKKLNYTFETVDSRPMSNYNKLGEVTKRINRRIEQYKKLDINQKEIQQYIKELPKEYRKYNRKSKLYMLVTPRNKKGKEKIEKIQQIVESNLPKVSEIKKVQKFYKENLNRKHDYNQILKTMYTIGSSNASDIINYLSEKYGIDLPDYDDKDDFVDGVFEDL